MSDERTALDALLGIVREFDLDALTVRVGSATYELVARPPAGSPAAVAGGEPSAAPYLAPEPKPAPMASVHTNKVGAPIIGVFYRSPAPGAGPFVEVGDRVVVGQALCILEAMKLMNEITSDYAGTVRRILPEDGALVSLDEELFWIEP